MTVFCGESVEGKHFLKYGSNGGSSKDECVMTKKKNMMQRWKKQSEINVIGLDDDASEVCVNGPKQRSADDFWLTELQV